MRLLKNISNIFRTHEPSVNRGMKSVPRRGVARDLSLALTEGAGNSFNFPLSTFILTLSLLFASCSDSLSMNEGPDESSQVTSEQIYFSLSVRPEVNADGTRAEAWEADGTETPLADENAINNMVVVLAKLTESSATDSGDYLYPYTEDTKKTFKVLAFSDIFKSDETSVFQADAEGKITVTGALDQNLLEDYLKNKNTGDDVYIFVIANSRSTAYLDHPVRDRNIQRTVNVPDATLKSLLPTGQIEETSGQFLMTSSEPLVIKNLKWDDIKDHVSDSNPYNLTANADGGKTYVPLHRLAARVDIDHTHLKFAFTETIGDEVVGEPVTGTTLPANTKFTVEIDGIALANVGMDYYLFQETGTPGTSDDTDATWNFLDSEQKEGVYARDPKGYNKITNTTGYIYNSLNGLKVTNGSSTKNHSDYHFRNVSDFTGSNRTDINGKTDVVDNSKYSIFSYTLPNVVYDPTKQLRKNSTAVIYRAKIGDNTYITTAKLTGDDIFAYGNEILGTYRTFYERALAADPGSYLRILFDTFWGLYLKNNPETVSDLQAQLQECENQIQAQEVVVAQTEEELQQMRDEGVSGDELEAMVVKLQTERQKLTAFQSNKAEVERKLAGQWQNADLDAEKLRQAALASGIRTYQATNIAAEGETPSYEYYCYYYYWIRHNNNNNGSVMGVMEYAIVRNYVYKLSVNKIYDLGYPEDPGDDPDPENPDNEVETGDLRLEVKGRIIPWGLRIDNDNVILK